jgi:hypothetical protein
LQVSEAISKKCAKQDRGQIPEKWNELPGVRGRIRELLLFIWQARKANPLIAFIRVTRRPFCIKSFDGILPEGNKIALRFLSLKVEWPRKLILLFLNKINVEMGALKIRKSVIVSCFQRCNTLIFVLNFYRLAGAKYIC